MSENRNRKSLDMTQGDPVKLLILFAIPMWIGGVFQLLYNMVDTIVVGRYVSIDALASIGAAASTTAFIMFVGNSATNALSVIISQAEGAKRERYMKQAIAHAVYLVAGMGVLLGLVSFFGARPLMTLLRTPENIIDGSVTYIKIVGGLTLAQMAYNGVSSVLRAIGDSRTPLYFLIFSSLLNVGLDLAFVLGLNAGVAGVAYATVISQAVSAILCLIYMVKRYPRLVPDREAWRFDSRVFGDYVRIGVPMVVQSIVLNVGMFVITAVINSFGSGTVAAYTIGSKVEQLAMITFSNVAFSFSVYSGQNFGARRYDRIKEGLKRGVLLVAGLALVSTVVMMIFARPLALIFMEEENATVLERAVAMIRIEAVFFVVLGSIWAVTSTLRGMGAIKVTLVSSVMELVSKIGFSLLLPLFLGYIGVWLAAPFGWILGLIPPLAYLLWWAKNPQERSEKLRGSKEKKA